MPSKSKAQHNFMEMIAHNKEMAKKKGVPQSVGKDFEKADKGKTFKKGGEMKKMAKGGETMGPRNMSKDVVAGSDKHGKHGESKVQKSGHTRGMNLGDSGPKEKIETEKNMKSFMKKYAKGGTIIGEPMRSVKTSGGHKPHGDGIAERGKTRAMMPKMKGRTI